MMSAVLAAVAAKEVDCLRPLGHHFSFHQPPVASWLLLAIVGERGNPYEVFRLPGGFRSRLVDSSASSSWSSPQISSAWERMRRGRRIGGVGSSVDTDEAIKELSSPSPPSSSSESTKPPTSGVRTLPVLLVCASSWRRQERQRTPASRMVVPRAICVCRLAVTTGGMREAHTRPP